MPTYLNLTSIAMAVASVGVLLSVLVLLRQLRRGRLRTAIRSAIITAALTLFILAAAVPLGIAPDSVITAAVP